MHVCIVLHFNFKTTEKEGMHLKEILKANKDLFVIIKGSYFSFQFLWKLRREGELCAVVVVPLHEHLRAVVHGDPWQVVHLLTWKTINQIIKTMHTLGSDFFYANLGPKFGHISNGITHSLFPIQIIFLLLTLKGICPIF